MTLPSEPDLAALANAQRHMVHAHTFCSQCVKHAANLDDLAAVLRAANLRSDVPEVATRRWWTDGAMVNCGLPGDEGFVGDAETPDDAQRIADQHNAALAASHPLPSEPDPDRTPDFMAADRALAADHREDDQPCGCDECMSYGAEDEGFDWYKVSPARRIVLRVLDSGDDRLAAVATAFREHEEASDDSAL